MNAEGKDEITWRNYPHEEAEKLSSGIIKTDGIVFVLYFISFGETQENFEFPFFSNNPQVITLQTSQMMRRIFSQKWHLIIVREIHQKRPRPDTPNFQEKQLTVIVSIHSSTRRKKSRQNSQ